MDNTADMMDGKGQASGGRNFLSAAVSLICNEKSTPEAL